MKLTSFDNGVTIEVDREKITDLGPHADGGTFVKVNGLTYHVSEHVDAILSKPPF